MMILCQFRQRYLIIINSKKIVKKIRKRFFECFLGFELKDFDQEKWITVNLNL